MMVHTTYSRDLMTKILIYVWYWKDERVQYSMREPKHLSIDYKDTRIMITKTNRNYIRAN